MFSGLFDINHNHDCELCPARSNCTIPDAFSITKFWNAEQLYANPPELEDYLNGTIPPEVLNVNLEEVTIDEGKVYAFVNGLPLMAILFKDDGSTPTNVDFFELYEKCGQPQPSLLGVTLDMLPEVHFGDNRPVMDRCAALFNFKHIDSPDGNRIVIAVKSTRNGILLTDEYMFAIQGWQAYPDPLPEHQMGYPPGSESLQYLDVLLAALLGQQLPPLPPS